MNASFFIFFIFNPYWVKSANKIYVNYNKILRSRNILSIKNCYFISKLLYCVCTKSKIRGHSKYLEHFLLPICNDYRQRRVEKRIKLQLFQIKELILSIFFNLIRTAFFKYGTLLSRSFKCCLFSGLVGGSVWSVYIIVKKCRMWSML